MDELLVSAGLTELQAKAYLYLLEHGQTPPPALAAHLSITRTNAYKVLDALLGLNLASKHEVRKKLVYRAADPTALASLVADKRNAVIALEKSVNTAMQQLRSTYSKHYGTSSAVTRYGKQRMLEAYQNQAEQQQDIYFIKSRADIPFLGFEAMHRVRTLANRYDIQRYGITPDGPEGVVDPKIDAHSKLVRTWVPTESYTAPVEWSASGDCLLIHVFDKNGRVVVVRDAEIADAFRQMWHLLDESIRQRPDYDQLPIHARRRV